MATAVHRIYCIDSSSLIYCGRSFAARGARLPFFAPVWELLDRLADEKRLIAPHLVHDKITRNRDVIGQWALDHAGIFRPRGEFAHLVVEILKEPDQRLVDPTAPRGAEECDPWVIALAEGITAVDPTLFDARPLGIVVAEENKTGGIADICRRRAVEHLDFTQMLAAEGLSLGKSAAT